MNLDDYVEQGVASLMTQLPYATKTTGGVKGFRAALALTIKEAMRDQRHGCAEALMATDVGVLTDCKNRLHRAVMNAEPKEQA